MRAICILFAFAIAVGAVTLTEEQAPQGVLNPTAGPRLITAIIDCTPEKRTAVSTLVVYFKAIYLRTDAGGCLTCSGGLLR